MRPRQHTLTAFTSLQDTLFNSFQRGTGRVDSLLLDDLAELHADKHVLHYQCCDYQMPLLQGNAHYRRWVADVAPAFATVGRPLLRCAAAAGCFRSRSRAVADECRCFFTAARAACASMLAVTSKVTITFTWCSRR